MVGTKRPVIILQDRDLRLLEEMNTMRVVNRKQAQIIAGFRSTTRVNTRLLALTRAGFLRRIFLGGNEAAYTLAAAKIPMAAGTPAMLFAKHQLAVNDLYLAASAPRLPADVDPIRWVRFSEPLSKSIGLIPDGYLEAQLASGVRCMFVEADLGTEALTVWRGKIHNYLDLAVSGEFSRLFQQVQFRVLVVTGTERRLQNIRATVRRLTAKIFWFSTFPLINQEGFWSPVWLRPEREQRFSLL